MITMTTGTQVSFRENEQVSAIGTVTRVWPNGRYVTIRSEGRTFVRDVRNVQVTSDDHGPDQCCPGCCEVPWYRHPQDCPNEAV